MTRDTLKRHVSTHGAAAIAAWTDQEPRDHRRACEACAKAKQRCDGGGVSSAPCSKCMNKGRQCVYPASSAHEGNMDGESVMIDTQPPGDLTQDDGPFHTQASEPFITQSGPMTMHADGGENSMQHDSSEQTAAVPPAADVFSTQLDYGLPWDDFLVSPQFLFPFSPPQSLGTGDLENHCSGLQQEYANHAHNLDTTISNEIRPVEAFQEFGTLTPEEEDLLVAEYVPHVPPLGTEMRAHIIHMLKAELQPAQTEDLGASFPTSRHLDSYMQLYFEHFHPRMPVLHVPTFRTSPKAWLLVLAIVCVGCDYSKASLKSEHRRLLQSLAQQLLKTDVSLGNIYHSTGHLLTGCVMAADNAVSRHRRIDSRSSIVAISASVLIDRSSRCPCECAALP